MPKPMPSPRGTNIERLTMPGPVAAYDAALEADTLQKLSDFLTDKITPEDLDMVKKILDDDSDDSDATMAGDAKRHYDNVRTQYCRGFLNSQEYERALLSPPPRPRTAADVARFAEMFPHAARLKIG